MDKIELIKTHYLFRDLDAGMQTRIAQLASTRKVEAGQYVFFKYDPGDALYGVVSGRVDITATAPSGREAVLNTIYPGEIFGEIALLDGQRRSADALAAVDSELVILHRQNFLPLMKEDVNLALHMLDLVCGRVRWISQRVEDFSFLNVEGRLAKLILNMAKRLGEDTAEGRRIDISQSEVGRILGISRVSVNKHLQQWLKEDWIALGRGNIVLKDIPGLEGFVENAMDEL